MKLLLQSIIKQETQIRNTYGILEGSAGYLLLLFYKKDYDKLYNEIEEIVTNFNKKRHTILYSTGISGLLWVLDLINKNPNITYLDDIIITLKENLTTTLTQLSEFNDFDFLHGRTGIIHALLDSEIDTALKNIIYSYIKDLKQEAKKKSDGFYLEFYQPVQKKYLINFSLSHGISAIIQVLSRIYKKGIKPQESLELLNGYIKFVLNNKNDINSVGSNFPHTLESKGIKSRLAWCYGDLGMAIAIWQAGDNTQNEEWKKEAERILLQTTKRTTLEDGMIVDPMICHGTSGIATIYNRIWRNTGNEVFLQARNHWLKETKKFARFSDGVAGYKYYLPDVDQWETKYGLLEGAIGIALTFLQAESQEDINWDKALLISS